MKRSLIFRFVVFVHIFVVSFALLPCKACCGELSDSPVVVFSTSMGEFKVELDREKAPITVDNFLKYVESEFYRQTIVHEVLKGPNKLIIGGMYDTELVEKEPSLPPIRNEAPQTRSNVRGTISMARKQNDANSATSSFFINAMDNLVLDYILKEDDIYDPDKFGYCVFGRVISGMEVVDAICQVAVSLQGDLPYCPIEKVVIHSIKKQVPPRCVKRWKPGGRAIFRGRLRSVLNKVK